MSSDQDKTSGFSLKDLITPPFMIPLLIAVGLVIWIYVRPILAGP
jgi:hypothetical protein